VSAQVPDQLVVFGDSLSDNGNLFAATGNPPPPYYMGRFSNGPVWVEYLADRLNVPLNDFAYGDAQTDTNNADLPGTGIEAQVAGYLTAHPTLDASALYILQGGTDDYLAGQSNPAIPVGNLTGELTELAQHGAKRFLVMNLPDLGLTPELLGTFLQGPGTQLSQANNLLLADSLQGLSASFPGDQFKLLDMYSIQHEVTADPTAFGFTNVTDAYLLNGSGDPNKYLYWDAGHPTTAAHQLIADFAYAEVVPEPGTLALLCGLAIPVLCRIRRRSPRAV
jgi:outer membrane lipase/esterase